MGNIRSFGRFQPKATKAKKVSANAMPKRSFFNRIKSFFKRKVA